MDDSATPGFGLGPLYHRKYSVEFPLRGWDLHRLFRELKADLGACALEGIARIEKTVGPYFEVREGDRYLVRLVGPREASLTVARVSDLSFRLVTLEDDPEVGAIDFAVCSAGPDRGRLEIESWARSRDPLTDFLYDRFPVVRMAQTQMWVHFCQRFARRAAGDGRLRLAVLAEREPLRREEL